MPIVETLHESKRLGLQLALIERIGVNMKANEGNFDRGARVIVGLAILSLVVVGPQTLWGLVGLIPLATGAVGFCPLYRVFGLSTCPLAHK